MATIKSYTDLEQSKKLAKILPIESADMFYNEELDETYPKDIIDTKYPKVIREGQKHYLEEYGIPCWSLAALLNYLRSKDKFPEIEALSDGRFKMTTYIWDGEHCIQVSIRDTIVDACYELILKLHELNLL